MKENLRWNTNIGRILSLKVEILKFWYWLDYWIGKFQSSSSQAKIRANFYGDLVKSQW
jgi:hypothetical protein